MSTSYVTELARAMFCVIWLIVVMYSHLQSKKHKHMKTVIISCTLNYVMWGLFVAYEYDDPFKTVDFISVMNAYFLPGFVPPHGYHDFFVEAPFNTIEKKGIASSTPINQIQTSVVGMNGVHWTLLHV
ncbi:hypothetical protein ACJX0J_041118 [Zea mays]